MNRRAWLLAAAMSLAAVSVNVTSAQERSVQPYIDQLKLGLEEQGPPAESITESVGRKLQEESPDFMSSEGYSERLKREAMEGRSIDSQESFIDREKAKLSPESKEGPIRALKEGRSELKARKKGDIHHAAGFRINAFVKRDFAALPGASQRNFSDIYGGHGRWAPDFTFFYEFQPFHSEWFGNIGFVVSGGFAYFTGKGTFQNAPLKPVEDPAVPSERFSSISQTKFRFSTVPVSLGVNYRFNLLRLVRPYVQVHPTLIAYRESRSDNGRAFRGNSRSLAYGGGVNIYLDFLAPKSSWELYEDYAVKKYYLTVDYTRLSTIGGDIRFASNAFGLGLTYEY